VIRAVVIGAGTMGMGIAIAFAANGFETTLIDASEEALARARARAEKRGVTSIITTTGDDEALATADVVVEAVFEDLEIKREVFRKLDALCKPDALLASNTSTLDIDLIADDLPSAGRIVGMHFWNPAHVNPALEIIRAAKTSPDALRRSVELGEQLGKIPVVVGNCDGFVANRMLFKYIREVETMVEEGATVADVDRALVEFGFPMGPFAMMDLAGIDVGWRVRQGRLQRGGYPYRIGVLFDRLHERDRFGQKTGAGFYRYEKGSYEPIADGVVEEIAEAERGKRGLAKVVPTSQEIVERSMWSMVNEGAYILDEGIAERSADIDAIWRPGFGFPEAKGGPMQYADSVGLAHVLSFVRERAKEDPEFWRPSPLLERLVAENRSFSDVHHPNPIGATA
jgi:3-hydroxyacyl-CoA dehydrogenase